MRDIFERFDFDTPIDRLAKAGLPYLLTEKFAAADRGINSSVQNRGLRACQFLTGP